jgi:hypothetical protein
VPIPVVVSVTVDELAKARRSRMYRLNAVVLRLLGVVKAGPRLRYHPRLVERTSYQVE